MFNILVKTVFCKNSIKIQHFIKTSRNLTYTLLVIVLLYPLNSCDKAETNLGPGSVTQIEWTDAIHGRITDNRDNREYAVVLIGDQVWMAENFAYNAGAGCWAYNDDDNNVATYGRLYDWETAKSVCPIGWHLPTNADWSQLAEYISTDNGGYITHGDWWNKVGGHLKSNYGWDEDGNGTNDYGFSGLPGGFRSIFLNSFDYIGQHGMWWSATEWDNPSSVYWDLGYRAESFGSLSADKRDGFSVRYIQD